MRRAILSLAALTLLLSSFGWAVAEDDFQCRRNSTNFGDELETFMTQEQFSVPMSGETLQVTAAKNGGVKLIPGTGTEYQVTVCKYAGAGNQSEGNEILKQITTQHSSSAISVQGPSENRWTASMIIQVPQGANMSVSAHNGPLSARKISGTFKLHTQNGPLSVNGVTGDVKASAQNGPLEFRGVDGNYDLETHNGPLSIELAEAWQNGKLDARSENGPVSLSLPKGYKAGVVLSSDGHSPMSCHADACSEARKTWDDNGKKIEFGSSTPVIHISTHNGPVSVGNDGDETEM